MSDDTLRLPSGSVPASGLVAVAPDVQPVADPVFPLFMNKGTGARGNPNRLPASAQPYAPYAPYASRSEDRHRRMDGA